MSDDHAPTQVAYKVVSPVAYIRLDNPARRNALGHETFLRLYDAAREANADPSVRVVIVTATGGHFSVGADLKWEKDFTADDVITIMRQHSHMSLELRNAPKPYIAAVRGYCLGGGNELALYSDLTVASETAVFGNPEARVGMVPFWYAPQLLPLAVGERRAREMILLGWRYPAREALEMGLCNIVVPDADLESTALAWASELVENGALALRLAKVSLNSAGDLLRVAANHEAAMAPFLLGGEWDAGIEKFFASRTKR